MKISAILMLGAGLCSAAPKGETTAQYQSLIDSELLISNETTTLAGLIKSFSGSKSQQCALQAQASVVDAAIQAGSKLVLTLPALSDVQAAGLLTYFGTGTIGLATLINKTIIETIAAKPAFVLANTGAVVLFTLETLNASSAVYANEIIALVPAALQFIAQSSAIGPIFASLAQGLKVYADQAGGSTTVDCSVATTSSSSSSIPAASSSTSFSSSSTNVVVTTASSSSSADAITTSMTSASTLTISTISLSSSGSSVSTASLSPTSYSASSSLASSVLATSVSGSLASMSSAPYPTVSSSLLSMPTASTSIVGGGTTLTQEAGNPTTSSPPFVATTLLGVKPSLSLSMFAGAALPTAAAGFGAAMVAAVGLGAFAIL